MRHRFAPLLALVSVLPLLGCGQDYERTLAAAGALGCAAIGSTMKGGGKSGRLLRGVLGAGACGIVGGLIGRALDTRDRQRMEAATTQVLAVRLPANYYASSYAPAETYEAPSDAPARQPPPPKRSLRKNSTAAKSATRRKPAPAPEATSAPPPEPMPEPTAEPPQESTAEAPAPPPSSPGRFEALPRAPQAQWVSDHSGASGSATIIAAEPAAAGRGECRTVALQALVPNQEPITETAKYCEANPGANDWQRL